MIIPVQRWSRLTGGHPKTLLVGDPMSRHHDVPCKKMDTHGSAATQLILSLPTEPLMKPAVQGQRAQ